MSASVVLIVAMVVLVCEVMMDKDWVQERIDELYLLEKQAQDRLGRQLIDYNPLTSFGFLNIHRWVIMPTMPSRR